MPEDIRALTRQLAEDPASLAFLALGEALRRRRQLGHARAIARAGLTRHPDMADAHDLLARIECDRGDFAEAFDLWAAAVRIDPDHAGAHKGLGFLYHQAGDPARSAEHLALAVARFPDDAGLQRALARARAEAARAAAAAPAPAPQPVPATAAAAEAAASPPAPAPERGGASAASGPAGALPFFFEEPDVPEEPLRPFAALDGEEEGLLLLDLQGLRLGGMLRTGRGDVADEVAAQLAGVSRDAARACRLLGLGEFRSLAAEGPGANFHLVQPTESTVLLTYRDAGVPAGRLALLAERAARAARVWMEALG